MLKIQPVATDSDDVAHRTTQLGTTSEMWKAILGRDQSKDGLFVFGVRSTGIYCKPSCPSKRPMAENVQFFANHAEAERSGFRPCKRCNPNEERPQTRADLVRQICEYIDLNVERKLTLANLSQQAGMSPFYFQRTFKKVLGISPREYVEAKRLERVKQSLRQGETVTDATYGAGFSSKGRLYEKSPGQLGVNPGTFRRGGEGLSVNYTIVDSPIGQTLLGATARGICAVCIGASDEAVEAALKEDYFAADLYRDDQRMKEWAEQFSKYFNGNEFPSDLPIDVQATAFQWKVWRQIQSIPYGMTSTYSEIAQNIGNPKAVRAVANACANNHVALLIPCHRVVGKHGDLRGYRWGMKRKQSLLSMEKSGLGTY